MTKQSKYLFASAVLVLVVIVNASHAGTVTFSATPPVVDGIDQANLVAGTGLGYVWGDRPIDGNTFTSDAKGGFLNALTVQLYEGVDDAPINGWKDYKIRVGTVSGVPDFTELLIETIRQTPDVTPDYYYTFTLTEPFELSPSTLYGFQVGLAGSQEDWHSGITRIRLESGNNFAGGQRFTGENSSAADTQVSYKTGNDLIFHLDIDAPPPAGTVIAIK